MEPIDYKRLWKTAYRAWRIWMRDDHRYGAFGSWARCPLLSRFYEAARQVTRGRLSKHEMLIERLRAPAGT
jgi:hypothetical protein